RRTAFSLCRTTVTQRDVRAVTETAPVGWAAASTFAAPRPLEKPGRLIAHPLYEPADGVVRHQRVDGRVIVRQFAFGKQGMDLAMTDPVQNGRLLAAFGLGNQVVFVALVVRHDPAAERTTLFDGRVVPGFGDAFGHATA